MKYKILASLLFIAFLCAICAAPVDILIGGFHPALVMIPFIIMGVISGIIVLCVLWETPL